VKIALVSEHADPLAALGGADAGGQNVHVAALAGGLARRGHEVSVFTRRDATGTPGTVLCQDGYVVRRLTAGPPTDIPKDQLLQHMPAFGRRLREHLDADPPDVVHAHFWMSGLASLDAVAGSGIPVAQTFHALGSVKRREQGAADTSPRRRVELERRLCRRVDRVIATCTDEVAELRDLGHPDSRCSVIPCGVDTEHFRPAARRDPDGPARLLFLGRLVTRKGIGNTIEALADLPGVELVIAGGPRPDALEADPAVVRLRALADELGVGGRVRFLGGVTRAEVPGLIRDCDVVVTVPWYEPFGIVPLEAMACGRPLVGSAVGGLLDTVVPGQTGELVPPRRPDLVAEAVRALLADPERRAAYALASRERAVDLYDWRHVVTQTEREYAALAGVAARSTPTTEVIR
jgi:glycosyltransferase involved in cell wall biosynthesis